MQYDFISIMYTPGSPARVRTSVLGIFSLPLYAKKLSESGCVQVVQFSGRLSTLYSYTAV